MSRLSLKVNQFKRRNDEDELKKPQVPSPKYESPITDEEFTPVPYPYENKLNCFYKSLNLYFDSHLTRDQYKMWWNEIYPDAKKIPRSERACSEAFL
jgi:hypothetical protein